MCAQPAYQPGAKQRVTARKPGRGTSDSIRKMAVLFTDVVGSSTYFKSYGDLAGREMLRKHQELASGPVAEHGGVVVKVLGDSVMAYFTEPREALKAAVRIQQRFALNNRGKEPKGRILVRIGLHYGDGIVEKGDIYGDVVNITAKFLPLVQGGEIFVSGQLQEQVRGLPWARFEKLKLKVTTEILKTLAIYRLSWDDQADLDPSQTTVLVLKPAWNLAKDGFDAAWKRLLQRKTGLWPGKPGQHTGLPDGSLALYLKEPSEAPGIARNALRLLRESLGRDRMPFLPLQILIDKGHFKRAGKPALEGIEQSLALAKPGEISVSRPAFGAMKVPSGYKVIAPEEGSETGLFRMTPEATPDRDDSCLFLYQHSMGHGRHAPCFYCGDRRHLPGDCPSKQLPDVTHGLERLGYHSL
ncbi:MAG: adenylate/guanylate cyclase domain-containing protein, partial [Deltaproteobacteria bacterium]|nr:adenylate/guanylate cyclase domain-containing protein [Deltaproteobacteria bacterium]